MIDLSILIPAYMEEENLRIILPKLKALEEQIDIKLEVLIIEPQEKIDNTDETVKEFGYKCIRRRGGNYYGNAITTGIEEASGEHTVFMDADGSHDPKFIKELWNSKDGADVVVASRYVSGGETNNPLSLILMSRILNITYSLMLGLKCKDVSNSFKLYKTRDLKQLQLNCDNFDIVEEIIYKISLLKKLESKKIIIQEIPFRFEKRLYGKSKRNLMLFVFSYIFTIMKLRLQK